MSQATRPVITIQRTYCADVDVLAGSNDAALDVAAEMAVGLLVNWSVIAGIAFEDEDLDVDSMVTIRFTGTRSQLEQLVDRLNPQD